MKNKLFKKFLSFSYGAWLGLVLGVITTMVTTRLFIPEMLGKASMYELFIQVGLIFVIFGTDQSFTRFFYEETEKNRGALLYNSIKLPFLFLIIINILILLFNGPITSFLFGTKNYKLGILLVIGLSFQLFLRYAQLVIRMQQQGNLYSLLQILNRLFNLSFIIIFFYLIGNEYTVLIYSNVLTLILLTLIGIHIGRKYWSIKNINKKGVKHSQKEIITYGIPFLFTLFITWIFETFDRIAIRYWSDFSELGMYSASMKLVALVIVLQTTFQTFWAPVSFEQFENDPNNREFFRNMTIIVSFVMFFVSIGSIMGKDVIVLLLGKEYSAAATLMPFLVFIPVMHTISNITVIGIDFYKKTVWHIPVVVISSIVNIVGNWIMVPKLGALGASISTAVAYIVFFTFRTNISLKFYFVNYPLFKVYTMVCVVSVYAFFAINNVNFLLNILVGLISIFLLIVLYYKDLKLMIRNKNLKSV